MSPAVRRIAFLATMWSLMALAVWPTAVTFGPEIEGRVFPVVSHTTFKHSIPVDFNVTAVWGSFHKERECSFKRLEWYQTASGLPDVIVPVTYLEGAKNRGEGLHEFGEWRVNMAHGMVESNSLIIAFHRCHPLWLTETIMYRGES